MIPQGLRAFAILIAVAGFVDPAITTARRVRPEVAVFAADSIRHGALADRIAGALGDEFRVLRAPFAAAAASVAVGHGLPPGAAALATPVFVILPEESPHVHFETVDAPRTAPLDAAVPVDAVVHVTAEGGRLELALVAGGVPADRVVRDLTRGDERHRVRLRYVPTSVGAVPLRVTAALDGVERAAADAVVDVRDAAWTVLFYDSRPSWQSTFVRRTLERDPRFRIASRTVTSRDASIAAGAAPLSLAEAEALSGYDAIVVGAPEGMSADGVAALERYLRARGGSVVLLLDNDAGGLYDRLTGVRAWQAARAADAALIRSDAGDTLRASELRWPRPLPSGATAIARDGADRPVLWRSPVGAGRLIASGALDSWRFRDAAASSFDAFWRARIAEAAAASAPAIGLRLEPAVLRPGASTDAIVTLRDLALTAVAPGAELRANVRAWLDGANGTVPLRVWPDGMPGRLRAAVRAPAAPGLYRVRVTSGDSEAETVLHVAADAAAAEPDRPDLLEAWTRARGGAVLRSSETRALAATLRRSLEPAYRREPWHPLRSAWWIVPFVLALGAEWWWRRRRGHP